MVYLGHQQQMLFKSVRFRWIALWIAWECLLTM